MLGYFCVAQRALNQIFGPPFYALKFKLENILQGRNEPFFDKHVGAILKRSEMYGEFFDIPVLHVCQVIQGDFNNLFKAFAKVWPDRFSGDVLKAFIKPAPQGLIAFGVYNKCERQLLAAVSALEG